MRNHLRHVWIIVVASALLPLAACSTGGGGDVQTGAPPQVDTQLHDPADDPLPDYDDETDDPDIDSDDPLPDLPEPERVTFRVLGKGRATAITWYVDGHISQRTNVKLPWKKTVAVDEPAFSGFNMNAQHGVGGKITCVIEQDGGELDRHVSRGLYAFVSCLTADPNY